MLLPTTRTICPGCAAAKAAETVVYGAAKVPVSGEAVEILSTNSVSLSGCTVSQKL